MLKQAFLIILIADVLLGYHSEEGWTAVIRMVGSRYGDVPEVSQCSIALKQTTCIFALSNPVTG